MKKILIIYDRSLNHINNIFYFLKAFEKFSKHKIFFFDYNFNKKVDFSYEGFDCIVLFYSLRLSVQDTSHQFFEYLKNFNGMKIIFSQDEQDFMNNLNFIINKININHVFTPISSDKINLIFQKNSTVKFTSILTSYMNKDFAIKNLIKTSDRKILISYRGRKEHLRYGSLCYDKYKIGRDVKNYCLKNNIKNIDIDFRNFSRIYGKKWFNFLNNSKSVLVAETGCNLIDWNNDLKIEIDKLISENNSMSENEILNNFLKKREIANLFNSIPPRFFEAVLHKCVPISYKSNYMGLIKPNVHYLVLDRDCKNLNLIMKKLSDEDFVNSFVQNNYEFFLKQKTFQFENFIKLFDNEVGLFNYSNKNELIIDRKNDFKDYPLRNHLIVFHNLWSNLPSGLKYIIKFFMPLKLKNKVINVIKKIFF